MAQCTEKCGMCDQHGLPIMLTRYALAPADSGAPKAADAMKSEDIELGDGAYYTRRMLRGGYLYLYNPANKRTPWIAYLINGDGGYLYPFPIPKAGPGNIPMNIPKPKNGEPSPCIAEKSAHLARAIAIPEPENAEDIWIGYSNVQWTQKVWESYNANIDGCRDKTMRKFNVKSWLERLMHDHALKIADYGENIAEFASALKWNTFAFSHAKLHGRASGAGSTDWPKLAAQVRLSRNAAPGFILQKLGKKAGQRIHEAYLGPSGEAIRMFDELKQGAGVVLTLDDPVAVAMDLVTLMELQTEEFCRQQTRDHEREIWNSATLRALRQNVEIEADEEIFKKEKFSTTVAGSILGVPLAMPAMEKAFIDRYAPNREKRWHEYAFRKKAQPDGDGAKSEPESGTEDAHHKAGLNEQSKKDGKTEQSKKDDQYEPRYDEEKRAAEDARYQAELDKLSEKQLVGMARAHVAWMNSNLFKDAMTLPFDPDNPNSGAIYSLLFSYCVGTTADKTKPLAQYMTWLEETPLNRTNLFFRAITMDNTENMETLAKAVSDGSLGILTGKTVSGMIKQLSKAVGDKDKAEEERKILNRLVNVFRQPFLALYEKHLKSHRANGTIPRWLTLLGWCTRQVLLPVQVERSLTGTLANLEKTIAKTLGIKRLPGELSAVANASLANRTQINGIVAVEPGLLKAEHARVAGENIKAPGSARIEPSAVRDSIHYDLTQQDFIDKHKELVNKELDRAATKGFPNAVKIGGGIFDIMNVLAMWDAIGKAADQDKNLAEPCSKLASGVVGIVVFISNLAEMALAQPSYLKFGAAVNRFTARIALFGSAKWMGFVGPTVTLVWDIWNGIESARNGEDGLMYAYAASAVVDAGMLSVITISVLAGKATAAQAAGETVGAVAAKALNISKAVSLTGIGLILFFISLGTGAWLAHEKTEKRKHELWVWIEKSYWGTATEGKYQSLQEEQLALERI